jgi:protein phosphatase
MSELSLPEFSLVMLIGASGCGKSTFAAKHFKPTEVISSDKSRALVADDETDQSVTHQAFEIVYFLAEKRLAHRRLTVIDATNVKPEDRRGFIDLARKYHALACAIVLNPGEQLCHDRNKARHDRQFGPHVVRQQTANLKRGLRGLKREGFRYIYQLGSVEEIEYASVKRHKLWTDKRDETGPFDIIGDVHGCIDELKSLLRKLGYKFTLNGRGANRQATFTPPEGRKAVFVGDLVDRGPNSPDVLRIVMAAVESGGGYCVIGNHDDKFSRWLKGRNVQLTHGLADTVEQMGREPQVFHDQVRAFIDKLVSHYMLDGGKLAVAHAGIKQNMQGRASGAIKSFCMYGETTGEKDEFGLPVRYPWANDYGGRAMVVYGHTPVRDADWVNNTICIDTGCVFGGKLSALRYPEMELIEVPAAKVYAKSLRPLAPSKPEPKDDDRVLDIEDVIGKRAIATRYNRRVTINPANATAALEGMSRFAVHPKWLIYLPPTMSPPETSKLDGFLEHPEQALDYYRQAGVEKIVAQEKHMGSRAIIVVCKDRKSAVARFDALKGETGAIYTRTGRPFFADAKLRERILKRLRAAIDKAGLWRLLDTGWLCLDAEIMPWSAKAQALISQQYAPAAAAARIGLGAVESLLDQASGNGQELGKLPATIAVKRQQASAFAAAYRQYCWPARQTGDYRIAPFHILASEGQVHMDKTHVWHMKQIAKLAKSGDQLFMATSQKQADLADDKACARVIDWWLKMTAQGGEGMVVKPLDFIVTGAKGLIQPAVKCRGRDYLRIIYGPEYDTGANLNRLRRRGLGRKRSLAARELALGHEALTRFTRHEPLSRVHECVFAVLALETEPVDPRL